MKFKILLGALLVLMLTSDVASAQRYHGHRGYRRGYYRRGPAVVVVPPRPVVVAPGPVVVRRGYYGPRYRRGYYGPRYRRGYYNRGYHRGYYSGRRGYHRHRW